MKMMVLGKKVVLLIVMLMMIVMMVIKMGKVIMTKMCQRNESVVGGPDVLAVAVPEVAAAVPEVAAAVPAVAAAVPVVAADLGVAEDFGGEVSPVAAIPEVAAHPVAAVATPKPGHLSHGKLTCSPSTSLENKATPRATVPRYTWATLALVALRQTQIV